MPRYRIECSVEARVTVEVEALEEDEARDLAIPAAYEELPLGLCVDSVQVEAVEHVRV